MKRTTQLPDECQMNLDVKKWTSMSEGRGYLSMFTRLAFYCNISFYLIMQHTPLWRSKFWIPRIKKTRTKIGTLRISHTSSKLHRDIRSGCFTETNLEKVGAITDKVWWLSRAYKYSPNVSGVLFLLVSVFHPFSKHDILMSALAGFKKPLKIFSSRDVSWCFLYHLWRCKLKPTQNGNLKESIIDLSRNIISTTYLHTFILLNVFWIRTQ